MFIFERSYIEGVRLDIKVKKFRYDKFDVGRVDG